MGATLKIRAGDMPDRRENDEVSAEDARAIADEVFAAVGEAITQQPSTNEATWEGLHQFMVNLRRLKEVYGLLTAEQALTLVKHYVGRVAESEIRHQTGVVFLPSFNEPFEGGLIESKRPWLLYTAARHAGARRQHSD